MTDAMNVITDSIDGEDFAKDLAFDDDGMLGTSPRSVGAPRTHAGTSVDAGASRMISPIRSM